MSWDYEKYAGIEALHDIEKAALVGNQAAILALVDLNRRFRALFDEAWATRYQDGCIPEHSGFDFRRGLEDAIETAIETS